MNADKEQAVAASEEAYLDRLHAPLVERIVAALRPMLEPGGYGPTVPERGYAPDGHAIDPWNNVEWLRGEVERLRANTAGLYERAHSAEAEAARLRAAIEASLTCSMAAAPRMTLNAALKEEGFSRSADAFLRKRVRATRPSAVRLGGAQ